MAKRALIVWGGWAGHTPKESGELFAKELGDGGYEVVLRDTLDAYADAELMGSLDLIVPLWTMGEIKAEQWKGLSEAVKRGVGVAGFHGGMIDSFRTNTEYQWMTGGQWVAHPGNCIRRYTVRIADPEHEITRGIDAFEMMDTEQYYVHVDPANDVLCSTVFEGAYGDTTLYSQGTVMPYAWTKHWGSGRVFVACWGHTHKDFDVPEAREIVKRGMLWASR